MPLFTISTITLAIKGLIVAAKSAKICAIGAKVVSYAVAHGTTVATVAAGTVTTGIVIGGGIAAHNAFTQSAAGFSKMREGLATGKLSVFLDGVNSLRKSYHSASELLGGFGDFLEMTESDGSLRELLKDGAEEFKNYIQVELTDQAVDLIREVEDFLKQNNLTYREYENRVEEIYNKYLQDIRYEDSEYMLAQAGKIYDEITRLNCEIGIKNKYDEYDHFLAYCIAGKILKRAGHSLLYKNQERLAADITNNIFSYIKTRNANLISSKFGKQNYQKNIERIYKHYFNEDVRDYQTLIFNAGKAFDEINTYNLRLGKRKINDKYDDFMVYVMAGWIIENLKHDYIRKLKQDQLSREITNNILGYLDSSKQLCPELLLSNYFNGRNYQANIIFLYKHYLHDKLGNYEELLSQAGKVYNEISSYNLRLGKQSSPEKFDHELVYFMAGWITDNRRKTYPFLYTVSQPALARAITDNIFKYVG